MLKIELGKAVSAVKEKSAKKVAVQIPEGLKHRALEIAEQIENRTGATVFTFVDPCYGACDLADLRAKALGAEMLVHFGHSQFLEKAEIETVYVPLKYGKPKTLEALAEGIAAKVNKGEKLALCTTIQYIDFLEEFGRVLEKKGFKVLVGKGKGVEQGQVLGCNYSSVKEVEGKAGAIVFLGDGLFHPLGISFCSEKKVLIANALSSEVKELEKEREMFLRKRFAAIARARDAKVFGIIVSTKKGQARLGTAEKLKKKIEEKGKKAFVLVSDFARPEYIIGMGLDTLVSTACPRIAFDDSSSYKQPVLSVKEVEIVLGAKKKYEIDAFLQ